MHSGEEVHKLRTQWAGADLEREPSSMPQMLCDISKEQHLSWASAASSIMRMATLPVGLLRGFKEARSPAGAKASEQEARCPHRHDQRTRRPGRRVAPTTSCPRAPHRAALTGLSPLRSCSDRPALG